MRSRNRFKKLFFVFLILLGIVSFFVFEAQKKNNDLRLSLYNSKEDVTINWWYNENDNKYYLFVPSFLDFDLVIKNSDYIEIEGKEIEDQSSFNEFIKNNEYIISDDDKQEYHLVVLVNSLEDSLFLTTEEGGFDRIKNNKNYKSEGLLKILNRNNINDITDNLFYVKGRGNASWNIDKKPLGIVLSEPMKVFGNNYTQNLCLINNCNDVTNLRNSIVQEMARQLEVVEVPDTKLVDVYINNEYFGVYTLSDAHKTDKDILIECDLDERLKDNKEYFISNLGQGIVVQYHNELIKDYYQQAKDLYNKFEEATLSSDSTNSLGKNYLDYADIDSFVNMYILQELSANHDAGITSFFYSIDTASEKLYMSNPWDFDLSLGSTFGSYGEEGYIEKNEFWTLIDRNATNPYTEEKLFNIFYYLNEHQEFRDLIKDRYLEIADSTVNNVCVYADNLLNTSLESMTNDYIRWKNGNYENIDENRDILINKYNEAITYLTDRHTNLLNHYQNNSYLFHIFYEGYDLKKDLIFNSEIISSEDSYFTIKNGVGDNFVYWEDENNNQYYPGDTVKGLDKDIYLHPVFE